MTGAGCSRMNGRYTWDGEYSGKPRYRHETEQDLYVRVGGRSYWGYGISEGKESIPGHGVGFFPNAGSAHFTKRRHFILKQVHNGRM